MARPPAPRKPTNTLRLTRPPGPREELIKVAGLPAVTALFQTDPDRVERLFFDERTKPHVEAFCKLLSARRKPYRFVPTEELTKVNGSPLHSGIVAVAHPRPQAVFDLSMAEAWAKAGKPLMILDGIGNPHNLGAIARSMAFFGLEHLLISDHPGQAKPSEAAYRVAEGGLEWVQVYAVTRLPELLKSLGAHYRVVGTALGAHRPLAQVMTKGDKPLAVVLGNEEEGLPSQTLAACQEVATIPGSGRVQSLNVSATASILAHLLANA